MDENTINSLREALKFSPGNIPLKKHLADTLLGAMRLDEAEKEYKELLSVSDTPPVKISLSRVFYLKGEYSQCNVILEELLHSGYSDFEVLILHAKALLKENSISKAIDTYQKALAINPSYRDEELDSELRLGAPGAEPDADDFGSPFIQKADIRFEDVGGMANIKKEIELKIIRPLQHPELYKAYGKKAGGGILLYGPPGCGKTYIARATAGQVNARFISVGLNDILDMWMGNSEKNLHHIFEIARQNTPCVLFFDEIDALGASRSDMKQSSGRHLINQFLQELDGIDGNNEGVLILGATNTPWHLDAAFRRPGRFDRIVFIPPPDAEARESILQLKLRNKPVEAIDFKALAARTEQYSGADLEAVIDIAIEEKLEEAFKDGVPKPLGTKDLLSSVKKHKASTAEWFATAKNFALFANDSGLYDDILTYMKLKK